MNLKNIFNLVFILALALCGCTKKLDQVPQTELSDESFWKTTNDLKLATNYLYTFLPDIMIDKLDDAMSIDAFGTSPNSVSDGSWLKPSSSEMWTNSYIVIRACNNILEKSVNVTGEAEEINKYLGEAKFFRAFSYFELVKRYGDVPLVLKTLLLGDSALFTARAPRAEVINSIYADLDEAADALPSAGDQPESDYGRITSTAALAFKSRVALFEGTRQKFFDYGSYQTHLQIAIDASSAVMTAGDNSLFHYAAQPDSSYFYNFQYIGEGKSNPENILVRIYGENETNDISGHSYSRDGLISPTRTIMDAYLYKDGLPIDKSPYYQPQANTYTEFENRDPRMAMSVFNKYSFYTYGLYVPTFQYAPTGYKSCKYFISRDWAANVSYIDNIIIRYAEVLLNNIEAKFELNSAVSDNELNETINLLRDRVNMPHLTNAFVSTNGLDMRTEIRRERRIELAYEGMRYWDIVRWKTAEDELPDAVVGAKYFPDEQGPLDDPQLTPDGFVIVQKTSNRRFDANKDYLWPIPTKELGLNVNLIQNPGW
ncbi:MAG: RagB/SusD family nutrient uptake outer membrane protein [Chitinophagaceae bacterium]|nr:RagB/SusD family nutrient uptake outer membrane protein [Chitinophagaceae bacterium]